MEENLEKDLKNLMYIIEMHHISSEPIQNLIARYKELEMQNKEFLLRLKADGLIERDKYWINKIKEKIVVLCSVKDEENLINAEYFIKVLQELLEES